MTYNNIRATTRDVIFIILMTSASVHADTIDHYMNIVNNIPQMEMKADPESQAWSRSARNILALTGESIAESLVLANETATRAGTPLYCPPATMKLSAEDMNNIIQQTYRDISSQESDKNNMTVSQVALLGICQKYPCQTLSQQNPATTRFNQAFQHVGG